MFSTMPFLKASANSKRVLPEIKTGSHRLTFRHLTFKLFQKVQINNGTAEKQINQVLRKKER